MSRYLGPRLRIVRRFGRIPSLTSKSSRRSSLTSQRNSSKMTRYSQYSIRLKEKQRLRFYYGIGERQLLNYFKKAKKKKGSSGIELLVLLEMRLDNIVYRMAMASSIFFARQLVLHGHILVNNFPVNIPSFICVPLDTVAVRDSNISRSLISKNLSLTKNKFLPSNLTFNTDRLQGKVLSIASRNSLIILINELLVVEYYSRKI